MDRHKNKICFSEGKTEEMLKKQDPLFPERKFLFGKPRKEKLKGKGEFIVFSIEGVEGVSTNKIFQEKK